MNISGVLVRTFPENIEAVAAQLTEFDGVEFHGSNTDGNLVLTVEQASADGLAELLVRMHDVPGVLSASMIYHQFDD